MLFALFLSLSLATGILAAPDDVAEAKASVQGLIKPLLMGKSKNRKKAGTFSVEQCKRHEIKWMDIILMKKTLTLNYNFGPGCDIEGTIRPLIFQKFPAVLKLKNLDAYNLIKTENRITLGLESKPVLFLAIRSGKLTGPNKIVKFEADYSIQINPLDKNNPIEKNRGGEMRITEIDGKKVLIKEKIFIK